MGRKKGGITVFLTLTGLLIFALLGTMVETARYTACKNHAARTLRTAIDGLMTEYSRPLYDHYSLFFIESSGTPYERVIAGYVGDTFEAAEKGDMDFLAGQTDSVEVTERVYMGDDGAGGLQEEINAYMKRSLTKKQLEKFLRQTKEAEETEKQAKEVEETVEEERELAELDRQVLELMKWIDGITVRSGRVSCQNEFVKMFATDKLEGENFGVTNDTVWKAMKKKLDKTPRKWEGVKKASFKTRVRNVRALTGQAIEKAEKLKRDFAASGRGGKRFAKHRQWLEKFIASLSTLEGNERVLSETEKILSEDLDKDAMAEKLEILWKDYDCSRICFDYTGIGVGKSEKNPMDALSTSFEGGILRLVSEKDKEISAKKIRNPDRFAEYYGKKKEDAEDFSKRISDFNEKEKVRLSGVANAVDYAMDEFCLDSYIQEKFSSYMDKETREWKTALQYQWEYAVAGGKSDKKNLESVLYRILLIRTAVNFAAIYQDSAKTIRAYATAAALVGFTGLEPLIRLMQTLILIVWSMVESLVDVAAILQGRNVPFMKSPSQVKTSYSQIFQITQSAITKRAKRWKKTKEGTFGYKEYIKMFLAATKPSLRRYRIMDMIQSDMKKNGYASMQLGTCVFGIKTKAVFTFPARLFRMAPVEAALGRDIRSYPAICEISASYV